MGPVYQQRLKAKPEVIQAVPPKNLALLQG